MRKFRFPDMAKEILGKLLQLQTWLENTTCPLFSASRRPFVASSPEQRATEGRRKLALGERSAARGHRHMRMKAPEVSPASPGAPPGRMVCLFAIRGFRFALPPANLLAPFQGAKGQRADLYRLNDVRSSGICLPAKSILGASARFSTWRSRVETFVRSQSNFGEL